MATIERRGRYWRARVRRRGYPVTDKACDTKAEAEAWAREVESQMDRGIFVSRAEAERTTLREALDRYALEVTPRKRQAAREHNRIKAFQRRPLAPRFLATIRGKDIADFIRTRESEGAGGNTIRLELALLGHLFETARKEWGWEGLTNPTRLVRKPKLPHGRARRLQTGEEERLLAAARARDGTIGSLIGWALETAMRRAEIAAMRWEHVDRAKRVLLVPETKTDTPRTVPLSSRALAILDTLPRQIDGRVWSLPPDAITQAFARVCTAAAIEDLTFHDLRHEAISRLFERGLNPMQVAAISGHKSMQMLKRYTHLRAEDLVALLG